MEGTEIIRPVGTFVLKGFVAAVVAISLCTWVWHWAPLGAYVAAGVVWVLGYGLAEDLWEVTPEGEAYVAVQQYAAQQLAIQQAEAQALAEQQRIEALRAYIIDEYRQRSGNPYAEVPEGYIVFRWNEMEKENAANARQAQLMAQQNQLAWDHMFNDDNNAQRDVRAIEHPTPQYVPGANVLNFAKPSN